MKVLGIRVDPQKTRYALVELKATMKLIGDRLPAFPVTCEESGDTAVYTGMTLRDYFAAAAITGLLSADRESGAAWGAFAEEAYSVADAMLAARQRDKK